VGVAGSLIAVAALTVYHNSLQGPFVFDDFRSIVGNASIRALWPPWSVLSPPSMGGVQNRPIVNLSLALNYAVGGLDVVGYHLFNLAVHIFVALTLFGVVRRTLLLPRLGERLGASATPLAFAVALIWTVHPLGTEPVDCIIQRTESMGSLAYLLTLYCAIRGMGSAAPTRWYALSVASCVLGAATKEMIASAPFIVLLYDRVFVNDSFSDISRRRWGLYAGLISTWALLIVLWLPTRGAARAEDVATSGWDYAMTEFGAIVHYLRLAFCPHPLIMDYGPELTTDPAKIVPAAIALGLVLAGTAIAFRFWPWVGFLGTTFFAILAPSSSVVPLVSQPIDEKRMYLPLATVVVGVVMLVHLKVEPWLRRLTQTSVAITPWIRRALAMLLVTAVAVLGGLTLRRNVDYRTEVAIWNDTVAKRPGNYRAYMSLGGAYLRLRQPSQALAPLGAAIALRPTRPTGYFDRAFAFESLGQKDAALRDYTVALKVDPAWAEAHAGRGKLLGQLGRYQEALVDLATATKLKPDMSDAHTNLGVVYDLLGRHAEAIESYSKAIALTPGDPELYQNRAVAYYGAGQFDQAWAEVARCRQLGFRVDPRFLQLLAAASGRSY
jgi:Flp pilus assembly protein TadD